MTMKVKCLTGVAIELPEGVTARREECLRCPSACPKSRGCFRFTFVDGKKCFKVSSTRANGNATRYSPEEATEFFGVANPYSADAAQERRAESAPEPRAERDVEPKGGQNSSHSRFAAFRKTTPERDAPVRNYVPVRNDDPVINIGGLKYALDRSKHPGAEPLCDAFEVIRAWWRLDDVFDDADGRRLKANFKDCLVAYHRQKQGRELDEERLQRLLSSRLDRDRKFFYLDAIFVHGDEDKAFYFPDKDRRNGKALTPLFIGEKQFEEKYFNAPSSFRKISEKLKREILFKLHYLTDFDADTAAVKDEEARLCAKLTCDSLSVSKKIVRFEGLGSDGTIVGSLEKLKRTMSDPGAPYDDKKTIDDFLGAYSISANGSITQRDATTGEYKSISVENTVGEICSAVGFKSPAMFADEYSRFLSMLHEYVRVFSPSSVTLGGKTFSAAKFSNEICSAVFEYVALACGDADDIEVRRARGFALFAKDLYEYDVLFGVENGEHVQKVLALLDNPTGKISKGNIESYLKLCGSPKIAANGNVVDIERYIADMLDGRGLRGALNALKTDVAAAYLEVRANAAPDIDSTIDSTMEKYEKLFAKF